MTKAGLLAYAAELGIDGVSGRDAKAVILDAVKEALNG